MPRDAAALTSAAKSRTTCRVAGDEIEIDRHGGEIDAVERALSVSRRRIEAESVRAHRAGEHQHQAGGAVLQIVERLRIGGRRIGMIDTLHDGPASAGRTPAERGRRGIARVERLDGQAVIGPAFEPRERRALEHGIDQAAPGLFALPGERRPGSGAAGPSSLQSAMPGTAGEPVQAVQLACHALPPLLARGERSSARSERGWGLSAILSASLRLATAPHHPLPARGKEKSDAPPLLRCRPCPRA